jgi:hypothetical protein
MRCAFLTFTLALLPVASFPARAGTWSDDFSRDTLGLDWRGDTNFFMTRAGVLEAESAHPIAPSPLNIVEIGDMWTDYVVQCSINIISPNLRDCTKGALILRHSGNNGYVFALHDATQTIEVYRLSSGEMLLSERAAIYLKTWYRLRAQLQGSTMSFYVNDRLIGTVTDSQSLRGAVGLAVQDAEEVLFDDFTVSGPDIPENERAQPTITSFQREGSIVHLSFTAFPPYDYAVQFASTLSSSNWQTLTNFRAKLSSFEAIASDTVTNGVRFYRLRKVPCLCR